MYTALDRCRVARVNGLPVIASMVGIPEIPPPVVQGHANIRGDYCLETLSFSVEKCYTYAKMFNSQHIFPETFVSLRFSRLYPSTRFRSSNGHRHFRYAKQYCFVIHFMYHIFISFYFFFFFVS